MASTYCKKPYLCKGNRKTRMIVGKLLRYFIPTILLIAVVFASKAENNDSTAAECQPYALVAELDYHNWETSLLHIDLHQPCRISAVSVFRLQSAGKRTGKAYKSVSDFLKAGKAVEVAAFVKKDLPRKHYSYVKPFHRLISLGRLII